MASRVLWILLVLVLALDTWGYSARHHQDALAPQAASEQPTGVAIARETAVPGPTVASASQAPASSTDSAPPTGPISNSELHAFLAAARAAEAVADPLQRCLSYPDPPGSHWSHEAVQAYCHYLTLPIPSQSELKDLIRNGHAAELDQRLADALKAQRSQPDSRGLLDRIYRDDFRDASMDLRSTLDAWLRQSPNSAFAYAASGVSYVAMAQAARGEGFVSSTSESNLASMQRLVGQAKTDLDKAVALNPQVTPAYAAMIDGDGLAGDGSYAMAAAQHGLAVDPSNYAIYRALLWLAEPKWMGSLDAMRKVTADAQTHAADNPLLVLMVPQAEANASGIDCGCRNPSQAPEYRKVFDQVARSDLLVSAGISADNSEQQDLAAIYFSEALRFDPTRVDERTSRAFNLVDLGEVQWAVTEGEQMAALRPNNKRAQDSAGYAHEKSGDFARAEQDFRASLAVEPGDAWTLTELGQIYDHHTAEWDKAWDIANTLIQLHPDNPNGWIIRASVQKDQPRSGLQETMTYFVAHFGDDPAQQNVASEMRRRLGQELNAGSSSPDKPRHSLHN